MTEPKWYRSRMKVWKKKITPPAVSNDRKRCESCSTEMSATPDGYVCFYCKFSETEMEVDL